MAATAPRLDVQKTTDRKTFAGMPEQFPPHGHGADVWEGR